MDVPADFQGFCNLSDIEALEHTPLCEQGLPETTYEALKRGAAMDPDAPALSFFVSAKTYQSPLVLSHSDLFARVTQTANALHELGIGRQDVVAYVLPNLPETHFTIWGGSAAGRVLAVNPMLDAAQIGTLLRAAEVKVLVTLEKTPGADVWEKMQEAIQLVPSLEHVLLCGVFDSMGSGAPPTALRRVSRLRDIANRSLQVADRKVPLSRLMQHVDRARADGLNFEPPEGSDISTMLCTGGTTGLPKIACRSHASEVFDCWAIWRFNPHVTKPGGAIICGLPLFHSNAIMITGLLPFMMGGHVVLTSPQGYRGDGVMANFWKIVDHYKATIFAGVPTVYSTLLDVSREGADLSSVEFGACGSAPMPVEVFNTFVENTNIPIVEGYGLTEGGVISSLNPTYPDRRRIGSIGLRLPYQDMRCAIMDSNDTFVRWAETDEVGAILISGPNVFEGYLIDTHNKGAFLQLDGKEWLNTGDLGRQDADGYFWLTGRKKEIIIRGGHNIDPKIIEEAMHKDHAVAIAAAIGRPDVKAGELPVLYYQSHTGAEIPCDELKRFAEENISERAAIPKDFVWLDTMPMTAVGKINKVALNMMEIERTILVEAKNAGVKITSLKVVQDAHRGMVAKLHIDQGEDALRQVLGRYAFAIDFD